MPFENLGSDPEPGENITRYIFDRKQFAPTTARVKPAAWEPASDNFTSVCRIRDLTESEIWDLGREYVATIQRPTILARADVSVRFVNGLGLSIEASEPPPRHANMGWPSEKHEMLSKAQVLAAESVLRLKP